MAFFQGIGKGYEWNGFGPIVYGGYVGGGMPVQQLYVRDAEPKYDFASQGTKPREAMIN